MKPIIPILLSCFVVAAAAPLAEVVRVHPDERLAQNVREFVATVNDSSPAQLQAYVRERYAESMLRGMTIEDSAGFLQGVREHRGSLELCCYGLSEQIPDGMAVAYIRSPTLESWSQLQIRFDDADRISSLMIVPAKPPEGFADLEALDDAGLAKELDAYLTRLTAQNAFSGAVLVARDGKTLFEQAYGLANREHEIANTIETRFRLGSMNKMFTAVAIAQLVEAGKLSFDDPIGRHLPDGWVTPEVGRKVRVRHLLNHTSGLGDYLEPMLDSPLYKFADMESYRELVDEDTLAFEPGSKWAYSNTGFLLAGAIVAHLSGTDYYSYVREKIYDPAGMTRSDHYDHTLPSPPLADGYFEHEGELRKNTLLLAPRGTSAGGGYSTVRDLLAFDRALRDGSLIGPKMREQLFNPQPDQNSPSYGYGFMVMSLRGDHEVGHGGTFPGTTAHLSIFLDSGYTFAALCNGLGAQAAYNKVLELMERVERE